jgi:hypothetical protein
MKLTHLFILAFLIPLIPLNASAQTLLTPVQKRTYALELLKQYDGEGLYVIDQINQLSKDNHFDRYAQEHTHRGVRNSIGTMVHEMNHIYSALMGWKMRPRDKTVHLCYYIGDSTNILVRSTQVFPTEEMGKLIRPELHTFRFKTYVYNKSEPIRLSSNTLGIYGLLDEWNAYYHGTRIDVEMYRWYQENTKGTPADWHTYFSTVGSVIPAYVEFKLYCLAYLIHAQKHYPHMYQDIMDNEPFIETFLRVDEQYDRLVQEYQQIKKNILHSLKQKGHSVSEDDEWIMIGRQGTGNFVREYNMLKKELDTTPYQQMLQNIRYKVQTTSN